MNPCPRVSVVIPTRNRSEALGETLEGLHNQTLASHEYEIVVADDGSTPRVGLPVWSSVPRCRLVRLEGCERSAARNAGARVSEGQIVVFLDDDISVGPNFLEGHLAAQREWPDALVVGSVRLPSDLLRTPFGRFRQALEQKGTPRDRGIVSAKNLCAAANISINRLSFLQLGGFDETMVSAEDQDLAMRHRGRGGVIAFAPEIGVVHRDVFCDLRSYCRRMEWAFEQMIPFCLRHPMWGDNVERDRVNGPLRWGAEPLTHTARKLAKSVITTPAVVEMLFPIASILERGIPDSRLLHRVYSLLLGAHIFWGYRKGLARSNGRVAVKTFDAERRAM
jgi:cellulose synthase/poly-beta-1,6-N-acetylglucosamine synthase-like glycosyltransferase